VYGKIFQDIFQSTLMFNQGWASVYVFSSMVVLADKDGVVPYDNRGLYRMLGMEAGQGHLEVTFGDFMDIIDKLSEPDDLSNLPDHEGRRIIPLHLVPEHKGDRGFWIVNYEYYLNKGSKADRQEQNSRNQQSFRDRNASATVSDRKRSSAKSAHIDVDVDVEVDKKKEKSTVERSARRAAAIRLLEYCNQKTGKNHRTTGKGADTNIRIVMARLEEYDEQTLRGVIIDRCSRWKGDPKKEEWLRPSTLFGKEKCSQYVGELPIK